MKYGKVILYNLVIIAIGAAIYFVISNRSNILTNSADTPNIVTEQSNLASKTITVGNVIYKVTPKKLTQNSSTWDFNFILDTHTGSLDQDLVSQVRLLVDSTEYQATSWEGDPPGGHHREGLLKFKPLNPKINSVNLKITPENSLSWEVNN